MTLTAAPEPIDFTAATAHDLWAGVAAAFAFDPDKHPRDHYGRWASLAEPGADDKAWLSAQAAPWIAKLDRKEVSDLQGYKGSAFYPVNNMLRHPDWPDNPLDASNYGTHAKSVADYGDLVAGLDSAIAKSSLDRHLVVHRGVSAKATGICEAFDRGALTPGTEFTDAGFASTSIDPKAAASFKKGWGKSGTGAVLHIALSPGDKAVHLGVGLEARYLADRSQPPMSPGYYNDVEHELLLARNTTFRVLRTYEQGGLRHVDCAVVRQDPPPAAFAFDPDRHPRGEHGRWAAAEGADAAGVAWLAAHAAPWVAKLDRQEVTDLRGYKGDTHYAINKLLRDPAWPSTPKEVATFGTRAEAAESYGQWFSGIDTALAKAVIDRPLVVHRGVSATASSLCTAFDAGALTPGTEFTDAGYGSTSLSAAAASSFKKGFYGAAAGAVLHIALSPGDHGAHLGHEINARYEADRGRRVPDRSEQKDVEFEVLLPRNTTYRVLRVYTAGGLRHIDCAVARQDPPPPTAFAWEPEKHPRADGGRLYLVCYNQ